MQAAVIRQVGWTWEGVAAVSARLQVHDVQQGVQVAQVPAPRRLLRLHPCLEVRRPSKQRPGLAKQAKAHSCTPLHACMINEYLALPTHIGFQSLNLRQQSVLTKE